MGRSSRNLENGEKKRGGNPGLRERIGEQPLRKSLPRPAHATDRKILSRDRRSITEADGSGSGLEGRSGYRQDDARKVCFCVFAGASAIGGWSPLEKERMMEDEGAEKGGVRTIHVIQWMVLSVIETRHGKLRAGEIDDAAMKTMSCVPPM